MWFLLGAALAATPTPRAQGVLDVHEELARITGHVAVRCYVGEELDTWRLTRFMRPKIVDGWYSGVHRPDRSPELVEQHDGEGGWFSPLRLDWEPPEQGIVTTCIGRAPVRRSLEVVTVDAAGTPVAGVKVHTCMESTLTDASGRGVIEAVVDFPCDTDLHCEDGPCHTPTDLSEARGSVQVVVLPGEGDQRGDESVDASPGPGDMEAELAALQALEAARDFGEAGDRLLAQLIEHYTYVKHARDVRPQLRARARELHADGLPYGEARAQAREEHGLRPIPREE